MRLRALMLAGFVATTGCASYPSSYVSPNIAEADVPAIASGIVTYVRMRQEPAAGAIAVQAPPQDLVVAPQVEAALQQAGFNVTPSGQNRLTYQIEPRSTDGVLVRMTLNGERAARAYGRAAGGALAPIGPYTVTVGEAGR